MKEFKFEIGAENGLHARPCGLLIKEASGFKSDIKIELSRESGVKSANAKSLFSVMGLGAKKGEILHIFVEGKDEEEVASKVEAFMKENFSAEEKIEEEAVSKTEAFLEENFS